MADPTQDNPSGDLGSGTGFDTSDIGSSISDGISNIITGYSNGVAISAGGYPYGYDGYYPNGYVIATPQPLTSGGKAVATSAGLSSGTLIVLLLVAWYFLKKGG